MELPVVKNGDVEVPWIELRLDSHLANTVEDIDRNIGSCLERGLPGLQALVGTCSGPVSIVGSGPSLKENWERIADVGGDIIACNAACQFLLEKGVVPDYMFCFDADPLMLEFITPHPDITYLMASRCPIEAFDLLKDCDVVVWHANGDEHIQSLLEKHGSMEPMVSGGSAAVTRAMMLARPMGYNPMHLWGVDSSFANGDTHIRQSTTAERRFMVGVNGRAFETAPWMCVQANDFKILAPSLRDMGVHLVVHGGGMIPHLAKAMYFDVDDESRFSRAWKNLNIKSRVLWAQL